ncbi:hypothetical protein [Neisseria sp.]|uniref:hypothetical protein n=1 Tax=Neisseria sp. TaxID=192066 RepID=UPI0035A149B8
MNRKNKEEREILKLEAELARLKIRSGLLRQKQSRSDNIAQAVQLAGSLLSDGLARRAVKIPVARRYRLTAVAALALWKWCFGHTKRKG